MTRRVVILIAMVCGGLVLVVLGGRWLGFELDATLMFTLGAFFGVMAVIRPARGKKQDDDEPSLAELSLTTRLIMGVLCLGLIVTAVRRTNGIRVAIAHCQADYAQAGSDTLAVDSILPPGSPSPVGKYGRWMTCGRYRAQGFRP